MESILKFFFIFTFSAHATSNVEWVHNNPNYKGNERVVISDLSGGTIDINNSRSSVGVSTSSSPALMVIKQDAEAYSFSLAFKLSDGSVLIFDESLGNWLTLSESDFNNKFTFDSNTLLKMQKSFRSKSNTHLADISGECGNEAWHIDTGKACSISCASSSPGTLTKSSATDWINVKSFTLTSEWHSDAKDTCIVNIGSTSGTDGHWALTASATYRVYSDVRIAYPFGIGGYVEVYDFSYASQYTGKNSNEVRQLLFNDSISASAYIEATGHFLNLSGSDRYIGYAYGTGSSIVKHSVAIFDDGISSVPSGNHDAIKNGDIFISEDSYIYILQDVNGDIYSIDKNSMSLVVSGTSSTPISLLTNINKK